MPHRPLALLASAEASSPRGQMQIHPLSEGNTLVEAGQAGEPWAVFVGTLGFRPLGSDRTFATFPRPQGAGDLGPLASYRLGIRGLANVVEVHARGCEGNPMSAPPTLWPLVYPAP